MDVEDGGVGLAGGTLEVGYGVPAPPQLSEVGPRCRCGCRAASCRRGARRDAARRRAHRRHACGRPRASEPGPARRASAPARRRARRAGLVRRSRGPAGIGLFAQQRAKWSHGAAGARSVGTCDTRGRAAPAIHASTSSSRIRRRERSFDAGSSPSSIARRTAFSERPHRRATSDTESRCHSAGARFGAGCEAPGRFSLGREEAVSGQDERPGDAAGEALTLHT